MTRDKQTRAPAAANANANAAGTALGAPEMLLYSLGIAGIVILYVLPQTYVSDYWINTLLFPESVVSSFLSFCALTGLFIYPLTGMLLDRAPATSRRRLKMFLAFVACAAAASSLFIALPRSLPLFLKYLWSFVIYFIYRVTLPMLEIPHLAMMSSMTTDYKRRGALAAWRQTIAVVAGLACQLSILPLVRRFSVSNIVEGHFWAMVFFAAVAAPLFLLCVLFVKRRDPGYGHEKPKPRVTAFFKCLKGNTPALALMGCALCWGIADGFNAGPFFFRFYIQNQQAYTLNAVLSGAGYILACLIVIALLRFIPNKRNIGILSWIVSMCVSMLLWMCPVTLTWGLYVFHALTPLRAFFAQAGFIIMISLYPDVFEYTLDKYDIRAGAFTASFICLFLKLGSFIADRIYNGGLAFIGYFRSATLIQPPRVVNWIRLCAIPLPACFLLAGIFFLRMYKLNGISHDALLARLGRSE